MENTLKLLYLGHLMRPCKNCDSLSNMRKLFFDGEVQVGGLAALWVRIQTSFKTHKIGNLSNKMKKALVAIKNYIKNLIIYSISP
jgi:hypothetical protein